jgi:hypothetical protein
MGDESKCGPYGGGTPRPTHRSHLGSASRLTSRKRSCPSCGDCDPSPEVAGRHQPKACDPSAERPNGHCGSTLKMCGAGGRIRTDGQLFTKWAASQRCQPSVGKCGTGRGNSPNSRA